MDLETPDGRLHLEIDGDPDAPPLLLMHGITASSATWAWLLPDVVATHRVFRLDFRGHGRSDRMSDGYEFDGYVRDARAVCELVLGQPALVVGHSLGGATAAALAQQHPELVRGVVLEDPPLLSSAPDPDQVATLSEANTLLAGFRLMRESIPRLQASGISAADLAEALRAAPSPTGPTFGDLMFDDSLAAMAEALLQLDATVLDPVLDGTARPSFDPTRPLPVPGILVAADAALPDAVVQPNDVTLLAEHSPHIETRIAAGSGHMIHDSRTHRADVRAAVLDLAGRI